MIKRAFRTYQKILAGERVGAYLFLADFIRAVVTMSDAVALGRWILMRRPVDFGDFKLFMDPGSTSAPLLGKGFNKKESAYARDRLKPGDVAVDVGANIGFFCILFATLVGPRGKVVAFEPLPENVSILTRNTGLNNLTNVTIVPAACGESCQQSAMQVGGNFSIASMVADDENGADSESTRVVTIDSLLAS